MMGIEQGAAVQWYVLYGMKEMRVGHSVKSTTVLPMAKPVPIKLLFCSLAATQKEGGDQEQWVGMFLSFGSL